MPPSAQTGDDDARETKMVIRGCNGWMDGTAADADSVVVLICCTFLERVWVK